MRLNPDCIRDILISLENIVDFDIELLINETNTYELCNKYLPNEILYHLNQCIENSLLKGSNRENYIFIIDITLTGHAFLEDIRNDNNWNKTKEIAAEIGSFSLNAIKDIAVNVISAAITSSFK